MEENYSTILDNLKYQEEKIIFRVNLLDHEHADYHHKLLEAGEHHCALLGGEEEESHRVHV